jgi:hypothetical protein
MSDNKTTALVVNVNTEYAIKVGAKTRMVAAETLMVKGGVAAQTLLAEVGFAAAYAKARNGNYRAAVEIMGFAATPAQLKATQPQPNEAGHVVWTKARVAMLAELVLERKPKDPAKGWSKQVLKGRTMAHLVTKLFSDPPVTQQTPADNATDATPAPAQQPKGDALAGLEEAPM